MLMALYNVSISVKGLKCLSENPGLLPLILTLLDGKKTHSEQFKLTDTLSIIRLESMQR